MAKIDPNFPHDMFKFLHRPLRVIDAEQGDNFLERFLLGPQAIFEDTFSQINTLLDIIDPAKTRADLLQYLKDHVGFTSELASITQDLTESDLRKLISLAVALWKQKGTEPGYQNIVRLFTGKSVRVFNFFDFRLIVGEKAFGEEQLGEDSWLISVPGVEASNDVSNNVVSLLPFDGNPKDRSINVNDAVVNGFHGFFVAPSSGFPQTVEKYLRLQGGVVLQPNSSKYDLSGDFTVELFFRMQASQSKRPIVKKIDTNGVGLKIEIDSATNEVSYELNDGTLVVSDSFTPTADLDDNSPRHLALIVDRANDGARIYLDGVEASTTIPLGLLGDLTNIADFIIGGEGIGINTLLTDVSAFRLALNTVYDISFPTLAPPLSGFIEFQPELLHEFESDVRIVDEGDLNKILMLRILNLMRPSSERLNAIFIRFFDDFSVGSGRFITLSGSSRINIDQQLEMDPGSFLITDVLNDTEFKNIMLQTKANDTEGAGSVFSVLFFVQDNQNFYEFRANTISRELSLHKTVAGVSTQIGAPVPVDMVPRTSYIYTINTNFDPNTNDTLIQTFFDSNNVHRVRDSSFEKGKFGYLSTGDFLQIDEIEMFETPLDIQRVLPGFEL